MEDLRHYAQVEKTSAEAAAFARLSENRDFIVFCDYQARLFMEHGFNLLDGSYEGQEIDLLKKQGAYAWFNEMLNIVNSATDTTTPTARATNQRAESAKKRTGAAGIGGSRIIHPDYN